jgi:tRNA threonylcarbamoyladenosine biosynthesis protein TsaE
MSQTVDLALADEVATLALGAALADGLGRGDVIHLEGELGAGKTTLARGLIQALLPGARVRSPTYALVEPYAAPAYDLLHMDLYRLAAPEDLEALGVRERVGDAVIVAEWPERGGALLPRADLRITLAHDGDGRRARFESNGARGEALIRAATAARRA